MQRLKSKAMLAGAMLLLGGTALSGQGLTIRVEIDYMQDATHSHRPQQSEVDAVIAMFACKGITLIVDIDDNIGHTNLMSCASPGSGSFFTCTDSANSFATARNQFRDQGAGWHYCIFGHQYSDGNGINSSGIAELLGNDLFVADGVLDGSTATPFWRAATFAHELGHNLGLRHSAPGNTNTDPHSPNLASVMSYQYQLRGVKSRMECLGLVGNDHLLKDLDYSSGRMPRLTENLLNEAQGMGIRRTDWNCNGSIGGVVSKSLNSASDWCSQGSGTDALFDHDEWASITDVAFAAPEGGPYETCADMSELMDPLAGTCATPTLAIEPCPQGLMIFVDGNFTFPLQTGTGLTPYRYASQFVNAPSGSVVYLQPGTIKTASGAPLVLDTRMVLAGPGGALIDP